MDIGDLKKSPSARLRYLMDIYGFSTDYALERATGISRSTLKRILSKDRIGPKSARDIADAFHVSASWVESGFGETPLPPDDHPLATQLEGEERHSRVQLPSIWAVVDPWAAGEHLVNGFDDGGGDERTSVRVRLKTVMEAFNIDTGIALALASGLSSDLLGEIMSKDEIDPETAAFVAKRLGIEAKWLLSGEGPMQKPGSEIEGYRGEDSDQAAKKLTPPETVRKAAERAHGLGPAFSMVPKAAAKVSAGGGVIPEEGTTGEEYAFRLDWLKLVATSTKKVILVDVDGDSMCPTLLDKDTVLIDLGRTELRDGRIYAIAVGDVVQIKRLQWLPSNRIRVISDNPAYYTYEASPDELRIIGQMIWSARTWV